MTTPRVVVVGGGITGLAAGFTLQDEARRRGAPSVADRARCERHARRPRADHRRRWIRGRGRPQRVPQSRAGDAGAGRGARPRRAAGRRANPQQTAASSCAAAACARCPTRRRRCSRRRRCRGGASCGCCASRGRPARRTPTRRCTRSPPAASVAKPRRCWSTPRWRASRAGDSRELSVRSQFPMMMEMERDHGSLFRAMFARRKTGTARRVSQLRPRHGHAAGALAARLGPGAAKQRRGARHRPARAKRWRVRLDADETARSAITSCSRCPRTRRPPSLRLFDHQLPASLSSIPYAGMAVVALGYRRRGHSAPARWLRIPGDAAARIWPRSAWCGSRRCSRAARRGHRAAARHAGRRPAPRLVGALDDRC